MFPTKEVNIPEIIGKGYGEFWRCKKPYRVVKGSRGSKKSKTTALNIIYRMMQYPQANTLCIRKTFASLKDSVWSDLKWATYRLGVDHLWNFTKSPLEAVYIRTGQQILFRGVDDPFKITSISVPKGYLCWCWIEEAYEIDSEDDFATIDESIRGLLPEGYFSQMTLTFNPWSESTWIKKRFFDREDEDVFATTTTYLCNEWLSDADRAKLEKLKETNPARYRVSALGEWGIDGEAVFEEWRDNPEGYKTRQWSHVIDPFEIPSDWKIYRGFDFGYAKPFSIGWWACDHDGRIYRILELYGCTEEPNTGLKWTPDEIFTEVKRIEKEHRWLKGKHIIGVADPSIWDASRGISVAETGERIGVYFNPGDNKRIPGWMQMHYRLRFDENGIPMMYIFSSCKQFIRTVPTLKYDEVRPEDVDSDLEDHIADETRYVCMARPINPLPAPKKEPKPYNPLDDDEPFNTYNFFRKY